jgi:hypothetical protein
VAYIPDVLPSRAQPRQSQDASWRQIADETGIAFETLRRCCLAAEPRASHAMVPVQAVADPSGHTVTIVSANGDRIDDLTLQEAVPVLRAPDDPWHRRGVSLVRPTPMRFWPYIAAYCVCR